MYSRVSHLNKHTLSALWAAILGIITIITFFDYPNFGARLCDGNEEQRGEGVSIIITKVGIPTAIASVVIRITQRKFVF
jgi:hypothetical protein